jgi:hypothetical protein
MLVRAPQASSIICPLSRVGVRVARRADICEGTLILFKYLPLYQGGALRRVQAQIFAREALSSSNNCPYFAMGPSEELKGKCFPAVLLLIPGLREAFEED